LGIYSREEILAHEAVHGARSGFDENRCEEFFAYMTSEKKWRRVLGPILQRPWEVWPLFLTLVAGMAWPACYWGATLWMGIGFFRLVRQHAKLNRAAGQILKKTGDARKTRAILFRLTDREIELFAQGKDIEEYSQAQCCLRWRVIKNHF
jgi:hypothetical protein